LRNVLMLTYHFPPSSASGSFRLMGFARHLPRNGWRATVVSPPSLPWEPVDKGLLDKLPSETTVYSVAYPSNRVGRKLARYSCWLPAAALACEKALREQNPDVLLTSGPPQQVHWLGLWLKRRHGIPWVADFRDPWYPEGRMDRGTGFAGWKIRRQETTVFAAADAVIANAPGACATLRNDYPRLRSKFVTLPNGYDREAFAVAEPPPPLDGRPLRVVHTGAIYVGRDPRPLLDAIRSLDNTRRASLTADFYGPAPETDLDFPAEVASRGLEARVKVHGQVSYARCLKEITSADILLLMDTPGRTVGVPAKLYEYLGTGRPILALGETGGDLSLILSQSGIPYRIVRPGDPIRTTAALEELSAEILAGHAGHAGRDIHRFSRDAIAGRLAAVLDRCAGVDRGPSGPVAEFDSCDDAETVDESPRLASCGGHGVAEGR